MQKDSFIPPPQTFLHKAGHRMREEHPDFGKLSLTAFGVAAKGDLKVQTSRHSEAPGISGAKNLLTLGREPRCRIVLNTGRLFALLRETYKSKAPHKAGQALRSA